MSGPTDGVGRDRRRGAGAGQVGGAFSGESIAQWAPAGQEAIGHGVGEGSRAPAGPGVRERVLVAELRRRGALLTGPDAVTYRTAPSIKALAGDVEIIVAGGVCLIHPTTDCARQQLADQLAGEVGPPARADLLAAAAEVHVVTYREDNWTHAGLLRLAVGGLRTPIELPFTAAEAGAVRGVGRALQASCAEEPRHVDRGGTGTDRAGPGPPEELTGRRPGDTLVLTTPERLARPLTDARGIAGELTDAGAGLNIGGTGQDRSDRVQQEQPVRLRRAGTPTGAVPADPGTPPACGGVDVAGPDPTPRRWAPEPVGTGVRVLDGSAGRGQGRRVEGRRRAAPPAPVTGAGGPHPRQGGQGRQGRQGRWRGSEPEVSRSSVSGPAGGGSQGAQSIDRAAELLSRVIHAQHPVTYTELVAGTCLPRATVWRLLAALERGGLLARDAGGAYRGGAMFTHYATRHHEVEALVAAAQPYLQRVADQTGETVHLAVPRAGTVLHVARIGSRHVLGATDWVDLDCPAHCSALGKVLYAYAAIALPKGRLPGRTSRSIRDRRRLLAQLEVVRRRGFATACGEFEEGLDEVAAPVWAADAQVSAAIGICGPSSRLEARHDELGRLLAAQARRLSRALDRPGGAATGRLVVHREGSTP